MRIKVVLFDSGHTLMKPLNDEWFPCWKFDDILRQYGYPASNRDTMSVALEAGSAYLENNHDVQNIEEEFEQFSCYYRIVLNELNINPQDDLVGDLATAMVHHPNFEPYAETRDVLDQLHARAIPMGVITDAWPSAATKMTQLGFNDYFRTIVISSIERCTKPHPDIFAAAMRSFDASPDEVMFIDDSADIVNETRKLGFHALLIDRSHRGRSVGVIRDLRDLLDFI